MSGLNPNIDKILEAAVVITNKQFSSVFTFETAVFQPPKVLEEMNDWCKEHHARSGLTNRVPSGISEKELDIKLCEIVDAFFCVVIPLPMIESLSKPICLFILRSFITACLMFQVLKSSSKRYMERGMPKEILIVL